MTGGQGDLPEGHYIRFDRDLSDEELEAAILT